MNSGTEVWYDDHPWYSKTWGIAPDNANYMAWRGGGSGWVSVGNVVAGDIVYANWKNHNYSEISHAAVVAKVAGRNTFVDQHGGAGDTHYEEPIYKDGSTPSSTSKEPSMFLWFDNTSELP